LTYINADSEPCSVLAIRNYMAKMHKVGAGAVRECLHRLTKEGLIRHVGVGFYQRIDTGSAGADALERISPD